MKNMVWDLTKQLWSPPDVGVHKLSQRVTEGERELGLVMANQSSSPSMLWQEEQTILERCCSIFRVDCFEPKLWDS